MLGSPADCDICLHYFNDYRTVDHIDSKCYQLKLECGLGASGAGHGLEEDLTSYIEEI